MLHSSVDLGQHFIVGILGPTLSAEEAAMLASLRPSGIILFGKNIAQIPDWQPALRDLIDRARERSEREDFFVSIDHEGGRVCRFPEPITRFPAARHWGAWAGKVGGVMARELAALGFNLSFAPVLDVHSDENNPVIGPRAFSSDPSEVAALGLEFYHALEAAGVLACGKHFPGHGATVTDSHFQLPTLDIDEETMEARELHPFEVAIQDGIGMIMSAHVMFPQLDSEFPATLSRRIVSWLLREKLAFSGVVVTDDLEMKALDTYSPAEKAVLAMTAGNDILLEANPASGYALSVALKMREGLEEALRSGRLPIEVLQKSQLRILGLRERLSSLETRRVQVVPGLESLPLAEHQQFAKSLIALEKSAA